jgi:ribosomal protein L29
MGKVGITEPLSVEVTIGLPPTFAGELTPEFPDTTATVRSKVAELELAGPDPAYSAGRVDFAEMLKTDAQWSLKHRFDDLLGRPYLATQLAAMLPADVALRLVERAEAVIQLRVQAHLDQLLNEINRTTEDTIDRLAKQAQEKREELTRERFGRTTRLG